VKGRGIWILASAENQADDRIYSILPLAVERPAFLADYGISKQELLLRTMQECGADACM
jgi:hypothetical protein